MKIILGSSSPWRKSILETIIPEMGFEVMSPDIDEQAYEIDDARKLTSTLAIAKCVALRPRITEPAILITCDQVVTCGDKIRGKPHSLERTRFYLRSYRTMPVVSVASVHVLNMRSGLSYHGIDEVTVWFKGHELTDDVIVRLAAETPARESAGGFCIGHDSFKPYILDVTGERESVMGLPKKMTTELIAASLDEQEIES